MPNNNRKLYTVMLTGPQLSLITSALGALELKAIEASRAGQDVQWVFDLMGSTFMTVSDVQEEWYDDNGVER